MPADQWILQLYKPFHAKNREIWCIKCRNKKLEETGEQCLPNGKCGYLVTDSMNFSRVLSRLLPRKASQPNSLH